MQFSLAQSKCGYRRIINSIRVLNTQKSENTDCEGECGGGDVAAAVVQSNSSWIV